MFRKVASALALAVLLTAPAVPLTAAPPRNGAAADAATAIALPKTRAFAQSFVGEDKAPGIVIAVGKGDRPTTFIADGRLSDETGAPAVDRDTLWRVYSMTKPVTAMAAMMLIEDGKLSLDQPVADFIPAFADMQVLDTPDGDSLASHPAEHPITIRNLLTHTAGLGYNIISRGALKTAYEEQGILPAAVNAQTEPQMRAVRPASLKAFAERVATLPLAYEPGTRWSYSIGLDILGRVIEVASGQPFDTFVQQHILDPLDMTESYWTVPQAKADTLVTNYFWAGDARVPLDPAQSSVFLEAPSFPYGGAGLVMSARDYDRFLHMLQNGGTLDGARILKQRTVDLAMSDLLPDGVAFTGVAGTTGGNADAGPKMGFGAGGSVYLEDVPGGPARGTYGWGGAAGTIAWVDPANDVRGTVMVNYFPSDKWPLRQDVVRAVYSDLGD
ncbi:serine hydrolase domain-containing protein [Stakelama saccharophila]|uniref:Serine hydrolase domain-containing protein n=1 Tax=Stakelama saccharophila TaxID=3075605 RepID=A0ABZ0BA01_9SPHN|nr:serine hydrolase domain-containing protein [Stakelama sp. W311]WNO53941.1 serine hydrolase domain-containing protein [Stakelama sp. W311]